MTASQAQKVLITGASGFIGRHVTDACSRLGQEVVAIAGPNRPELPADSSSVPDSSSVQWVQLDLREPGGIATLLSEVKPDVVFHLAATGRWDTAVGDLTRVRDDLAMASSVIDAIVEHSPRAKLFAASAGALVRFTCDDLKFGGDLPEGWILDFDRFGRPYYAKTLTGEREWPCRYGLISEPSEAWLQARLSVEQLAVHAASERGVAVRIVRLFSPIGPGMPMESPLADIIEDGVEARPPESHRYSLSNASILNFLDSRDLGELIALLPEAASSLNASVQLSEHLLDGLSVVMGSDMQISTLELAQAASNLAGNTGTLEPPQTPGEIRHPLPGEDLLCIPPQSGMGVYAQSPIFRLFPAFSPRSVEQSIQDYLEWVS